MRYTPFTGKKTKHGRKLKASLGYTLIEVLISVTIFSATVTVACVALDQALKQYQRVAEKGVNFWDNARLLWIAKSFASTMNYLVNTKSAGYYPYFIGTQEMVSFVTSSPLASDEPVVAWVKKEVEPSGSTSLIYYELPIQTMKLEDMERALTFEDFKKGKSTAILSDVTDLEFGFYGYDEKGEVLQWESTYEGARTKRLPVSVSIAFTDPQATERRRLMFSVNTNSRKKFGGND
jgi:general secretion pathway protein J